jgi:hypothetical protein
MAGFLSLSTCGFTTTVLITGGGVTPTEGARCPGEVPATTMVMTPAEVVDASVPVVSTEPPTGTLSPANVVPTTFQRLGSGGEEEGLQHRQSKHPTTTRLENSTRRRSHTWWIRLRSLCACVPPDDPEGPMARLLPTPRMIRGSCSCLPSLQLPAPPGVSRSRLSRRWADHQTIEPFSLQLRRWGEGGTVRGHRIVVDNSDTTPCVAAEDFQEQQKVFQVVESLPALEDFVWRIAPGCREPCSHPAAPA